MPIRFSRIATFALLVSLSLPLQAQLWPAGHRLLTAPPPQGLEPPSQGEFGRVLVAGDYNGDGLADLAVGEPEYDGFMSEDAGRVLLYFGTSGGLAGEPGWSATGADGSQLGTALAAGDFNGDGTDELVIGSYGGPPLPPQAGALMVVQRLGETLTFDWIDQGATEAESAETDDRFGTALAVGDFDGDGIDDLAVGAPGEGLEASGDTNAGVVHVFLGVAARGSLPIPFDVAGGELVHQDVAGVAGAAESGDRFGAVLAAADLDCDGIDELAVGVPAEDLAATTDVGAVVVLTGSGDGLIAPGGSAVGSVELFQSDFGGSVEEGDRFGSSLAGGRLALDLAGCDELAIGAEREDVNLDADAGMIHLYRTGPPALLTTWTQTTVGALAEAGDGFGAALAAGDFDGRAGDELAIGAPYEVVAGDVQLGQVTIVPSSGGSLDPSGGVQLWPRPGLDSVMLAGEYQFGGTFAVGDFDGSGTDDLAIGAPNASVANGAQGAVFVLYSALFAEDFEAGGAGGWSVAVP